MLTPGGQLVALNQAAGGGAETVERALSGRWRVDVCAEKRRPPPPCAPDAGPRCAPLDALLARVGAYGNVFARRADYNGTACGGAARCARFPRSPPTFRPITDTARVRRVAAEASVSAGRVALWDEAAVLETSPSPGGVFFRYLSRARILTRRRYGATSWAARYSVNNRAAWIENYVGSGGATKALPPKREWPQRLTDGVRDGSIARVLDAGAGTCSLDAFLREAGLRSRVRLVSFGYYDCSMARVAAERGSMLFQWSWLAPLPFAPGSTFDVVFQAEGLHHTAMTPRKHAPPGACEDGDADYVCAQNLWRATFDHFDAVLACGGKLLVIDDVSVEAKTPRGSSAPRCWAEFGARWAASRGYEKVAHGGMLTHAVWDTAQASAGRGNAKKRRKADAARAAADPCHSAAGTGGGQMRLWVKKVC